MLGHVRECLMILSISMTPCGCFDDFYPASWKLRNLRHQDHMPINLRCSNASPARSENSEAPGMKGSWEVFRVKSWQRQVQVEE